MALDAARLGAAMEQAVRSSQGLDGTPYAQLTAYCNAIAEAIITEFKDNTVVKLTGNNEVTENMDGDGATVGYTIESLDAGSIE